MRISSLMLGAVLAAGCGGMDTAIDRDDRWTLDHATTAGGLLGVWGSGPSDVWVVGGQTDRSLVLHGDGTGWTPFDVSSTSLLFSVYGFTDSDVYAVGEHGLILHYDGKTWVTVESGTDLPLYGLWGASGEDVWIVGGGLSGPAGSAVVLRGARGSFHVVDLPADLAPNVLFKAHGFASDDVMLVGGGGAVLRWNGVQWRRDPVPTSASLFATWGRGADDAYAVGGSGTGEILHFDGQAWSQVNEGPIGSGLNGVFTSLEGPTIAVGPESVVIELGRDGSLVQPRLPKLDPAPFLHGVWGDGHGTTYAVGGDLFAYPGPMTGVILSRH
ncbi:MAG: hypothetical protein H6Q90_2355 [Deltaproteobacteria bacterium]|nr:hypothetical protein [Deltaproteobacteria bacterium]